MWNRGPPLWNPLDCVETRAAANALAASALTWVRWARCVARSIWMLTGRPLRSPDQHQLTSTSRVSTRVCPGCMQLLCAHRTPAPLESRLGSGVACMRAELHAARADSIHTRFRCHDPIRLHPPIASCVTMKFEEEGACRADVSSKAKRCFHSAYFTVFRPGAVQPCTPRRSSPQHYM